MTMEELWMGTGVTQTVHCNKASIVSHTLLIVTPVLPIVMNALITSHVLPAIL